MPSIVIKTVCLPLFGMFFSVVWSILFEWESSTATHCRVANYLPSVSAAIGSTPQAYIWRFCIALHCAPRILYADAYWTWYQLKPLNHNKALSKYRKILASFALYSHYVEMLGLIGLTVVSSTENADLHELGFILFISGSLCYMILSCIISNLIILDKKFQQQSKKLKQKLTIFNVTMFLAAMYFYYRHNKYCESGVYTLFAFAEYLIILSNVYFHYTIALDLKSFNIVLCDNEEFKVF